MQFYVYDNMPCSTSKHGNDGAHQPVPRIHRGHYAADQKKELLFFGVHMFNFKLQPPMSDGFGEVMRALCSQQR
jgi:hypothetical protein